MLTKSRRIATPIRIPVPITSKECVRKLQCLGGDGRGTTGEVIDDVTAGGRNDAECDKWRLAPGDHDIMVTMR